MDERVLPPMVRAVTLQESLDDEVPPPTFAYVDQRSREIKVLRYARRRKKGQLRCVARHEMAHLILQHPGRLSSLGEPQAHAEVARFMRSRWNERDFLCR